MNTRTLVLAGAFILAISSGSALALPATVNAVTAQPLPLPAAVFGHHRRIESYCYPRNYWWFYRPYTTANEGYARCMPYFHNLPQANDRRRGGGYAPPK